MQLYQKRQSDGKKKNEKGQGEINNKKRRERENKIIARKETKTKKS
jgi:hypothetical protein